MRMLKDNRAISTLFWAITFAFLVIPIFALAMEQGRFAFARAEVGKAADAAAVAAVTEVDYPMFYSTGRIEVTGDAFGVAQAYAGMNNSYLTKYGIQAYVSDIRVDNGNKTVLVAVTADVSPLFPSIVNGAVVTEIGTAQIRGFKR